MTNVAQGAVLKWKSGNVSSRMSVPQQYPGSNHLKKIAGLVILGAIIVLFALLWEVGFTINTVFDANLQSNQLYSTLPVAAQNAFTTNVNYQLTTYGFGYILITAMAVIGTIAAIFATQPVGPEDLENF